MARWTAKEFEERLAETLAAMREEALPFERDTADKRKARLLKAKADHLYFAKTYLPHYIYEGFAPFHPRMSQAAQVAEKPVLIASMGGGAKTTLVTIVEALHAILFKTSHFVVVGAMTEDLATQFTAMVKLELEENSRIKADFGTLKGDWKWEDGDLVTRTGIRLKARGARQPFRGLRWRQYRPSLVLLDDIEDEELARSDRRVTQVLAWLMATVLPRLEAKNWRLVLCGNVSNRTGVVGTLLNNPEFGKQWDKHVFPAEDSKGRPTWPDRFPKKALDNLKLVMGHVRYAAEMLCAPIDDAHFFRPEMTRTFAPELIPRLKDVIAYIDPSVLASKNADYKAIVALGHLPEDHREYVGGAWIRHATVDEMIAACYRMYDLLQVKTFYLEGIAFQRLLKRDFDRAAMARGRQLPISVITRVDEKDLDIERIVAPHDSGDLLFCREAGDTQTLLEQLYSWEPKGRAHDDGPDALSRCWKMRHGQRRKAHFRAA
jgi:predicted phage terminase large subunit-like protein